VLAAAEADFEPQVGGAGEQRGGIQRGPGGVAVRVDAGD
jgi:hypothetical protein